MGRGDFGRPWGGSSLPYPGCLGLFAYDVLNNMVLGPKHMRVKNSPQPGEILKKLCFEIETP
jgi:hypothetical protein